eukprot:11872094-Alexandrium_andersonii.AAC.1
MSASLVGSEMCIRDRASRPPYVPRRAAEPPQRPPAHQRGSVRAGEALFLCRQGRWAAAAAPAGHGEGSTRP